MTKITSIEEWRAEIDLVDAELMSLLSRRVQLAVDMLMLLRSEALTLGSARQDGDRLMVMLFGDPALIPEPLDKRAISEIYRRIVWESRRVAERAVSSIASKHDDAASVSDL
jgi:hypothetical protein